MIACAFCGAACETYRSRSQHEHRNHPAEWTSEHRAMRERERMARAHRNTYDRHRDEILAWHREHQRKHKLRNALRRAAQRESTRDARLAAMRAYAATPAGQAARRRSADRQSRIGSAQAHRTVQLAIQSGKLVREPCVRCGATSTEAHHYLGYAPEHRLHVVWLCRLHHEAAHHLVSAIRAELTA